MLVHEGPARVFDCEEDAIDAIKGGKIVVNETECSLNIEVSSDNNLNVSKLKGIESVINSLEVSENISSYAPLYYLIANTNNSNAKVKLVNNTLVIGD